MFKELAPYLRQRAVLLTVTRVEDDNIRINVIPQKLKDGENAALTTPLRRRRLRSGTERVAVTLEEKRIASTSWPRMMRRMSRSAFARNIGVRYPRSDHALLSTSDLSSRPGCCERLSCRSAATRCIPPTLSIGRPSGGSECDT